MYEGGRGAGTAIAGGLILPNTGGNTLLTVVAVTSIAVGAAIIVSTIIRAVAVKAYNA